MSEGSQITKPDKVSYMTQQIHRSNNYYCNDLLGAVGIDLLELLIDTLPCEKTGCQQSRCVLTEVFLSPSEFCGSTANIVSIIAAVPVHGVLISNVVSYTVF